MLPERLRRSCLTVPAASPRLLAKARFIPADQIMVDLEDGVAREQKTSETRAAAVAAVRDGEWGDRTVSVRVNGVDTPWCLDDLLAVVGGAGERLDSVVVPKVEAERHVHFLHQLLTQLDRGRAQPLAIEVQIESPKGLLELERILSASSRIEAVVYGPADYAASAGLPQLIVGEASPGAEYPMARIAATAHAFGIQAIDGPYARLDDIDGLHASAARARALGFHGKWVLHPAQVGTVNEVFTPTRAEYRAARAIIEELAAAGEAGRGAVASDGTMLDEASRRLASAVVARAQAAGVELAGA